MNFLTPTMAAATPEFLPPLALAAAPHQQTIGRVNSADSAPHAAASYLAGSPPDLLLIARAGAQSLAFHAPHN
jgi:hypothetical protein